MKIETLWEQKDKIDNTPEIKWKIVRRTNKQKVHAKNQGSKSCKLCLGGKLEIL